MKTLNDILLRFYFGPTKQKKYAGFFLRFIAFFIDFWIVFIFNSIVIRAFSLETSELTSEIFSLSDSFIIVTHPIFIISSWLYYALLESHQTYQATIGKRLLRLQVVDINEKKISFGKATGRHFAKYISAIILGIGFIMAGFTKYRQGLHDQAAGTFVIIRYE